MSDFKMPVPPHSQCMTESNNDIDKAILALNVDNLEELTILSSPISTVAKRARSRLLIVLFHPLFESGSGTDTWGVIQRILGHAYLQATAVSHEMNKILMNIEVLLRAPRSLLKDVPHDSWDMLFHSGNRSQFLFPDEFHAIPAFRIIDNSNATVIPEASTKPSTLPVVALGGTFDHLHSGHKILLSMAAWIAGKKLIVGMSDDALLVKKNNHELIESLNYRTKAVSDFLTLFKPGIEYDVVPITDIYGPTAWDPDIQALVVSKETISGAASVASVRESKSLPPLEIFVIDVISAMSSRLEIEDPDLLKKAKMSSTYIRKWILEQGSAKNGNK